MTVTEVETLNRSIQTTHEWLLEMSKEEGLGSEEQAYSALRGSLQALRDRLTVEEAAQLAAQLPLLLRGIFYENWRPAECPRRERSREEFLQHIASRMNRGDIPPESACRATFRMLSRRVSEGEIEDVQHMLPEPVRELWS